MNRKGDTSSGFWIILVVIFLIIVFIATSGSFGMFFKQVTDSVKGLLGFSTGQIDELKQQAIREADTAKDIARHERKAYLSNISTDAFNFLKDSKYDEAIDKYILYLKECKDEKEVIACGLPQDVIKFRILNVLREKAFVEVTNKKQVSGYNADILSGIITEEEFSSAITLVKSAGYTNISAFEDAQKSLNEYFKNYPGDKNELNFKYSNLLGYYLVIKRDERTDLTTCKVAIHFLYDIAEYAKKDADSLVLKSFSYQFLGNPRQEVNAVCKGS